MKRRTLTVCALTLGVAVAAALWTARSLADEDVAISTGPVKIITLSLAGPNAGKVYFEITPTESGAPSAFKLDASNVAAVQLLAAARSAPITVVGKKKLRMVVRVTYKPDFTVTEIEF
ncbi:MAG: hypothetical protein AAB368_01785 [bacterium]